MIGETVSHYRIDELLGSGGMGVVYRAEDLRLKRTVALKFLRADATQDREARDRLIAEAQTASALDHPNICTIYEVDETPDGRVFLAMSYYEGETLKQRIASGALPVPDAIALVAQIGRGVAAAHDAGIIHRDIKPANIMLTKRGEVKLLDFGIAKLTGGAALTRTGITVGTIAYMSPEQIAGKGADPRSDVWALGVVLYEMLAGRLPFDADNDVAMISAIVNAAPPALGASRTDLPPGLERIVMRALDKNRDQRYHSVSELLRDLEAMQHRASETPTVSIGAAATARGESTHRLAMLLTVGVIIASLAGGLVYRNSRRQQTRRTALATIASLHADEKFADAYRLLRKAETDFVGDREVAALRDAMLYELVVHTSPDGATMQIKGYEEPAADWIPVGQSPLENFRGPLGYYRWRVSKPGFETVERAGGASMEELTFTLPPAGTLPAGMVLATGEPVQVDGAGSAPVGEFFIDRTEVTNRDYKKFVDAGGYRQQEYWTETLVKDGRTVAWAEAMRELVDTTGRPGPSTWELGDYPQGQDDFPVRGVNWYEASAFAKYSGATLPTVYHWRAAAGAASIFSEILALSNFGGKGPAAVGTFAGLSESGTSDMAGNVREWCRNATGDKRYILGGAWNEPNYRFREADALSPFDRGATNGFRRMKLAAGATLNAALDRPIESVRRDYSKEQPVSDDVFRIFKGLYAYDRTAIDAAVESTDDSSPFWRRERVTYAAAYGGERIVAYLFLPKNTKPPYQTVIYFPHSGGEYMTSFQQSEMDFLGFIVKGGRALLLPMYKGTYERKLDRVPDGPNARRDLTVQRMKDLQRSVDYVQTRSELDFDRLGYFGVSLGARLGVVALALEPRFKAGVLWSGGFRGNRTLPEVDEINFAPRVMVPVLMLNGRDDFTFPIESSQLPMFRLLGTREPDKQRVLYEGGHVFPFARIIKDTLDWLDRYFGVVK